MTFDHSATPFPTRRPYAWLPALIISMTFVAIVIGTLVLHYVEDRLVTAVGQNLTLVAAEITDKLDRLMFERYGDSLIMANTFSEHMDDPAYLHDFLLLMKQAYAPFYVWLGVVSSDGTVLAATDSDGIGAARSGFKPSGIHDCGTSVTSGRMKRCRVRKRWHSPRRLSGRTEPFSAS